MRVDFFLETLCLTLIRRTMSSLNLIVSQSNGGDGNGKTMADMHGYSHRFFLEGTSDPHWPAYTGKEKGSLREWKSYLESATVGLTP